MVRARGRLRAPGTLRQPEGACPSTGSTLHRRMALDTEARSLRARSATPRRLRACLRRPPRCKRETRPSRSSSRLSAGLSTAGSRWSGMIPSSSRMESCPGRDSRVSDGSVGSRPPGFMWARASLRDRTAGVAVRRHPGPRAPLAVSYPAISLATATAGRHRCPQSASRPPANLPSTRIRGRIIACNSLTPFHGPRAVHRWIRAKAAPCPLPERPVPRAIPGRWCSGAGLRPGSAGAP